MDWDDVKVFLAVARAGQLLGAGKRLRLNHATVARRLGALEKAVGQTLVLRRPSGAALTPEGERFLIHAERIESQVLAAGDAMGIGEGALTGSVRIGAPDGFGSAYLAPRLVALAERYPELDIELVPVPRAFSLSRREADLAVTIERPREGRLVARKLTDYRLGLYGARSYLDRHGRPETLEALRGHRLVDYVEDMLFSTALAYGEEVMKGWHARTAVSTAIGQTEAVRAGAGIGILHGFIASRYPELEEVLPEARLFRSYWLAVHEDLRGLRRIALVSDFLAERVRADRALFV